VSSGCVDEQQVGPAGVRMASSLSRYAGIDVVIILYMISAVRKRPMPLICSRFVLEKLGEANRE